MPEFKKIYCAYHDKHFITNFCVESTYCLTQLIVVCLSVPAVLEPITNFTNKVDLNLPITVLIMYSIILTTVFLILLNHSKTNRKES